MHKRFLITFVGLIWPICATWAGDSVTSELCDRLANAHEQSSSPAMGILVATSEGVAEICVVGERAISTGIPVMRDDTWHLGSTGKAMTSTLVARLVEEGVVEWDDTVGEVLAPNVPNIDRGYESVTFKHLLSHRAGLPVDLADSEHDQFMGKLEDRDLVADRIVYASLVLDEPPEFEPGTRTEYSNNGYVVAGTMLEFITGKSWETLIQEELFAPLGISSAGFGAPGSTGKVDAPRGHKVGDDGETLIPLTGPEADNVLAGGPAGSIHMSLEDYSKFLVDHLRGARGLGNTLLSTESYEILHTPPFGYDPTPEGEAIRGYAMGWVIKDDLLYHSGSNTIWLMFTMMWPLEDRIVVVVANDGRGNVLYPLFVELGEFAKHLPSRASGPEPVAKSVFDSPSR